MKWDNITIEVMSKVKTKELINPFSIMSIVFMKVHLGDMNSITKKISTNTLNQIMGWMKLKQLK